MAEEASPVRDRLVRYDGRSAINAVRATFAGWPDRLLLLALLLFGWAMLRAWFGAQSATIGITAVAGAGLVLGVAAGRSVAARLTFHATDGVLAADALQGRTRRRYIIACHAVGTTALVGSLLLVKPALSLVCVPFYACGALIGQITGDLKWGGLERPRFARMVRPPLQRPAAGLAGALVTALPAVLIGRSAESEAALAGVGLVSCGVVLALTTVDASAIRFMILTGHRPFGIAWRHARATLAFVVLAAPACLLAIGASAAALVGAISLVALLVMAMRVLAYCLHGPRLAEVLVSLLAAVLIATAFYAPVILPILVVTTLWWLGRRAARRLWLLA